MSLVSATGDAEIIAAHSADAPESQNPLQVMENGDVIFYRPVGKLKLVQNPSDTKSKIFEVDAEFLKHSSGLPDDFTTSEFAPGFWSCGDIFVILDWSALQLKVARPDGTGASRLKRGVKGRQMRQPASSPFKMCVAMAPDVIFIWDLSRLREERRTLWWRRVMPCGTIATGRDATKTAPNTVFSVFVLRPDVIMVQEDDPAAPGGPVSVRLLFATPSFRETVKVVPKAEQSSSNCGVS